MHFVFFFQCLPSIPASACPVSMATARCACHVTGRLNPKSWSGSTLQTYWASTMSARWSRARTCISSRWVQGMALWFMCLKGCAVLSSSRGRVFWGQKGLIPSWCISAAVDNNGHCFVQEFTPMHASAEKFWLWKVTSLLWNEFYSFVVSLSSSDISHWLICISFEWQSILFE